MVALVREIALPRAVLVNSFAPPIVLDSLVSRWDFREGAGTNINDVSGVNDGTLNTAIGFWDNADHANDSIGTFVPTSFHNVTIPFTLASSFTCAVLLYLANASDAFAARRGILAHWNPSTLRGFTLRADSVGNGGFAYQTANGAGTGVEMTKALNWYFEQWLVIHIAYDGATNTMRWWFDKGAPQDAAQAAGIGASAQDFKIGWTNNDGGSASSYFKGRIAEVLYYDKVLSDAEVLQNYQNLSYRVNGAVSVDLIDSQMPGISKNSTPFTATYRMPELFTQLWTTENNIYVAEVTTVGGAQSRLARLNKSYVAQENVQLATGGLDGDWGHRGTSVGVHPSGTVVAYREQHAQPWAGKHTTSPENLSTLTTTATPTGADTSVSYRRFFTDGTELYLVIRGNNFNGRVYRWNDTAKTWTLLGNDPLTQWGGSSYGNELAFGSDGTIYMVTGSHNSSPGSPWRWVGVVKSADGTNWTHLDGTAITLPINNPNEQTNALAQSDSANHDALAARIVLDTSDNPIVIGAYQNRIHGATLRGLWMAKWSPNGGYFRKLLLFDHSGTYDLGSPYVASDGDTILVVINENVGQSDPNWGSGDLSATKGNLWALISTNAGESWRRWVLDPGTGSPAFWGAFVDKTAHVIDGVWRIMPWSLDVEQTSEIWEFATP